MSQVGWPDIATLRIKRKALNITQQQLAEISGVPQSIISRIEEGKILDPSYHTIRKLFEAFKYAAVNDNQEKQELVARELMNAKVVSVRPSDSTRKAWEIMKKNDFSQLPVIDDIGRPIGGITESSLLLFEESENDIDERVAGLMTDPFPIVGKDTPVSTLASILRTEQAVLVIDKGIIIGIITRYDLMENLYSKKSQSIG